MARPTNFERSRRNDIEQIDVAIERLQRELLDPSTEQRRLAPIAKSIALLRGQKYKIVLGAAPQVAPRPRGRPSNGLVRRIYKQRDGNWFGVWFRNGVEHVIEVKDSAHTVMTRQEVSDHTIAELEQRLEQLKRLACGCDRSTGCTCERLPCGCKRESAELLGHSCQEAASDTTTPDTAATADLLN